MALRKPKPEELFGVQYPRFDDQAFRDDYPSITEYLLTDRWTDGSPRLTATISIFTDGQSVKLVLNDRENQRSAFFCEPTFLGTLAAMESALTHDRVDWKTRGSDAAKKMQTPF